MERSDQRRVERSSPTAAQIAFVQALARAAEARDYVKMTERESCR